MSTKNNGYLAAVVAALGVVMAADASPICEGLLNDEVVTTMGAAEISANGKCIVLVTVGGAVRPVADATGNVRTYMDAASVMTLAKRVKLADGVKVQIVKHAAVSTVGDPLLALKGKYKSYKTEAVSAAKQATAIAAKVTAGAALGWDTAVGTPENLEYVDLVARSTSIGEWKTYCDDKVTTLSASLVAAGIDPATL